MDECVAGGMGETGREREQDLGKQRGGVDRLWAVVGCGWKRMRLGVAMSRIALNRLESSRRRGTETYTPACLELVWSWSRAGFGDGGSWKDKNRIAASSYEFARRVNKTPP